MLLKRLAFASLLIVFGLFVFACGNGASAPPESEPEISDDATEETSDEGSNGSELPEHLTEEAASALPESWMAYPGSVVATDWYERGMSAFPAWLLVVPPDSTREEVVEYYVGVAEERDDFETVEVFHGITGTWMWKGEYEIMIETDIYYDDPDLVQVTFAFHQALD